MTDFIIYEQPINELMRGCLRLEFLFKRIDHCLENSSIEESTETIISTLIDILELLDRPDLKSKLTKEFHRHVITFSNLSKLPGVDQDALQKTLKQLQSLMEHFLNNHGKIAQNLRDDVFISNIRQHFHYPGDCYIDSPIYVYWLQQDAELREHQIHQWLDSFTKIRSAIELLLKIARKCNEAREVEASNGFYHQNLNPDLPCQLIRVAIAKNQAFYPEISAGKHRMSVRFMVADPQAQPKQADKKIKFQLTCCAV